MIFFFVLTWPDSGGAVEREPDVGKERQLQYNPFGKMVKLSVEILNKLKVELCKCESVSHIPLRCPSQVFLLLEIRCKASRAASNCDNVASAPFHCRFCFIHHLKIHK